MNPWNEIALSDYESHMALDTVYQLQTLNELMREQLSTAADTVMILGIAGGNGLEHVEPAKGQTVYGVDVNSDYLAACVERYPELAGVFQPVEADLTAPELPLPRTQLLIANLLVEYIGCSCFRQVVERTEPEHISCVIQQDGGDGFVSDSPYEHAFDGLNAIHNTVSEGELTETLHSCGYEQSGRDCRPLPNGKRLLRLDFTNMKKE